MTLSRFIEMLNDIERVYDGDLVVYYNNHSFFPSEVSLIQVREKGLKDPIENKEYPAEKHILLV
jgi:hypothetical protein